MQVDTSNILFICGGAFADLATIIAQRSDQSGIGFGATVQERSQSMTNLKLLKDTEPEDLVKFGLIPEFIGRLPVIATLDELDEDALIEILTQPKNALIKQYAKLFELEGVEIEFRAAALKAIADKAIERKAGARGLRSIVENTLMDLMYEIPSMIGLQKVVIEESVITENAPPLYIYDNGAVQDSCA